MTEVQQARTAGFLEQLARRGLTLQLQPSGPSYQSLIEITQPNPEQYSLSQETRDSAVVHILRTDVASQVINVGDVFKNLSDNTTYRIVRVQNDPLNIAVRFHCEATFP